MSFHESAIYLPYEDEISNRERRSLRGPSKRVRRAIVQEAQRASGIRVRIDRPVLNQLDFKKELKIWIPAVQQGVAMRKGLGSLSITVFDTGQHPLRSVDIYTEDTLEEALSKKHPELFRPSPQIEVTGVAPFGDVSRPFIGLTFAPGYAHEEWLAVRNTVAPELALDDRHQRNHTPHVTLGQVFSYDRALEIIAALEPVIPGYVEFNPAKLVFDNPAG